MLYLKISPARNYIFWLMGFTCHQYSVLLSVFLMFLLAIWGSEKIPILISCPFISWIARFLLLAYRCSFWLLIADQIHHSKNSFFNSEHLLFHIKKIIVIKSWKALGETALLEGIYLCKIYTDFLGESWDLLASTMSEYIWEDHLCSWRVAVPLHL